MIVVLSKVQGKFNVVGDMVIEDWMPCRSCRRWQRRGRAKEQPELKFGRGEGAAKGRGGGAKDESGEEGVPVAIAEVVPAVELWRRGSSARWRRWWQRRRRNITDRPWGASGI